MIKACLNARRCLLTPNRPDGFHNTENVAGQYLFAYFVIRHNEGIIDGIDWFPGVQMQWHIASLAARPARNKSVTVSHTLNFLPHQAGDFGKRK